MKGVARCTDKPRLTSCSGSRSFRRFMKKHRRDDDLRPQFLKEGTSYLKSSNWAHRYFAARLIQRGKKASGPALLAALKKEQHPKALESIAEALVNVGQIWGYKPGLKGLIAESRKRKGATLEAIVGAMTAMETGKPGSKAFRARLAQVLPTATSANGAEKVCTALASHGTPGVKTIASVLTLKSWKAQPVRAAHCSRALQEAWADSLFAAAPVKLAYTLILKMLQDPAIGPLMLKAKAFKEMFYPWRSIVKDDSRQAPSFVDVPALTKALFKLTRTVALQPDTDFRYLLRMACMTGGLRGETAKAGANKAASKFVTDSSKAYDPRSKAIRECAGTLGWSKASFPGFLKTLEGIGSPTPADTQLIQYLRGQLAPKKRRSRRSR